MLALATLLNTPTTVPPASSRNLQLFGVRLLGLNPENGRKLLFTALFFLALYLTNLLLLAVTHPVSRGRSLRTVFWTRQAVSIFLFLLGALGFISIWFDNPTRLATGIGLVGAGLAFALQKVITAFAGYFVILRGKTFNVGDRITMGGVRGDVIALNFLQTVIMEMGEPPSVQSDDPSMWVQSRQYSGRIVTVSNSKIFDEPIYNYTRDFPYLWEEMHLSIAYQADRLRAEQILLDAARKETVQITDMAEPAAQILRDRYPIEATSLDPHVYLRLTSNWVELTVRFLCKDHDIRGLKDRMSRDIITHLDAANIRIASTPYNIVGLPPIHLEPPPIQPVR